MEGLTLCLKISLGNTLLFFIFFWSIEDKLFAYDYIDRSSDLHPVSVVVHSLIYPLVVFKHICVRNYANWEEQSVETK